MARIFCQYRLTVRNHPTVLYQPCGLSRPLNIFLATAIPTPIKGRPWPPAKSISPSPELRARAPCSAPLSLLPLSLFTSSSLPLSTGQCRTSSLPVLCLPLPISFPSTPTHRTPLVQGHTTGVQGHRPPALHLSLSLSPLLFSPLFLSFLSLNQPRTEAGTDEHHRWHTMTTSPTQVA